MAFFRSLNKVIKVKPALDNIFSKQQVKATVIMAEKLFNVAEKSPKPQEWDQLDSVYKYNWNFSNLEDAFGEGGKLYGQKAYQPQLFPLKGENKLTVMPVVVAVVSPFPSSAKIGINPVQRGAEEIVPMKQMKVDWVPYMPLEKRAALKHLKIDCVKKYEYCLPYFYQPFKEDELEQSTEVPIIFPAEPKLDAFREGGKLYGQRVYLFGCTEPQLVPLKGENKLTVIPVVVAVVSPFPPFDKIGINSVQREAEEIVPMKQMKVDWVPYIPLEKRATLKHLKIDCVKKYEYCLPYFYQPFKEDELEQSTEVPITFLAEPKADAFGEWGKLYGQRVYLFGCTESQLVPLKGENKLTVMPVVVAVVSPLPPFDKIGINSVQREAEEIVPMKQIKMQWAPYIPLEERAALKHLKIDRVKKYEYCLPYFYQPFKEDELEQSTEVPIIFPAEPKADAFGEGGKLYGQRVYLFGCTEPQLVPLKGENKLTVMPVVVALAKENSVKGETLADMKSNLRKADLQKNAQFLCIHCERLFSSATDVTEHDNCRWKINARGGFIHQNCGNRFIHPHELDEHSKFCNNYGYHKDNLQGYPASAYAAGDFHGKVILWYTDWKK